MTNKIYAFIGPHAAGKTTFLKKLLAMGVNYVPTYTTRQPGKFSSDRSVYRFIEKIDFFKRDFIVKTTYKGDYYGLVKKDVLDSLNDYPITVIIGDTSTVKQLAKLLKDSFESIYIMTDYVSLIERMLKLGHTNEEIKHHLEYAENNGEFESWKFTTHVVKNVSTEDKAMNQILSIMGLTEIMPEEKIKALTSRRSTEEV
ncbi:MAG: guanylate kinase [Schwartzia succinivorans]|uniref:guanylate kinase n=1 Tax=Schwartzia succinivorans TaxID=55507 RepID=UPI002353D24A|nr:guanylate kinase [Schwartzia succinivorans]MBE6097598.1 guanylate kinase [Schwartzia succinivorans]